MTNREFFLFGLNKVWKVDQELTTEDEGNLAATAYTLLQNRFDTQTTGQKWTLHSIYPFSKTTTIAQNPSPAPFKMVIW